MPALLEHFHSNGGLPERQWSSLVGIVTAIVGNIVISFALNTQRYAHIRIDREFKDTQDSDAKSARKRLPKNLRHYGAVAQQEEAAEERQRINENAEVPSEINGQQDAPVSPKQNGNGSALEEDCDNAEHDHEGEGPNRKSYLKSPWWWLGISLMTIGEAGNFLAYGFAPASIVSPLGVVGLISNCLIAPLMLKERFRQRDFWGILIAIGGAVTVVLSAKTSEKKLGPHGLWEDIKRWEFLAYVLITAVFIVALMMASPKYGPRTIMIDLGLVGLFGGYTALSTKGVASLLSTSLYRAFAYPIMYVLLLILVGSAVMQLRYLNRALQNFNSTQVIPVQFVMFTLSVIIGSAVLYRDFERTDVDHVLKFVFGCLLTFGGVYLITSERRQEDDEDEEAVRDHDVERIRLLDEETADKPVSLDGQDRDLKIDTSLEIPETPTSRLSRVSSAVASISTTPPASADAIDKDPWLSSIDHVPEGQTHESDRPQTPKHQTLPSSSTSQTPFFTPLTTQKPQDRLTRTLTSPAQPETPMRRSASPPKPSVEAQSGKRASISRLFPGPILQPFSSSLSGIVADRILRGEGTPSPMRSSVRRHKSNRESTRTRPPAARSETDLETGVSGAFATEGSIARARDAREVRSAVHRDDSPHLRLETINGGFGGSLRAIQGRLRRMSTSLLPGNRAAEDDGDGAIDEVDPGK